MILIANILGIIGWILLIYSYYKEDIDELLYLQLLSSLFYCLNYLLLGANVGLIICFFELIKTYLYYKTDKDDLIFKISLPIYFIIGIFSFSSMVDILPVIGSIIDSFGMSKNRILTVSSSMIANILWVIYDLLIGAYSVALTDMIVVLSNLSILITGHSRLIKSEKLKISRSHIVSKNTFKRIQEIDKKNYKENYLWDINYQKSVYLINKDSFIFIKYNNNIIGYINYLLIKKERYNEILHTKKTINSHDFNDITKLYKSKENYIHLESISVEKKFQNYKTISKIKKSFTKLIRNNYKRNISLNGFISIACTKFENETLEELGFIKIRELDDSNNLYELSKKAINDKYLSKEYKNKIEKEKYRIVLGKDIDDLLLKNIISLDKEFYSNEYLWEYEYQKKLFEINQNSFICILYEDKLIGYINYLSITKEKHEDIINSNKIIDHYNEEDITKFKKNRNNYITINSVVITKKYQNSIAIKLLTKKLKKEIKNLIKNGYKIEAISGTAISNDGRKFLEHIGFIKYKELDDNNILYIKEKF